MMKNIQIKNNTQPQFGLRKRKDDLNERNKYYGREKAK